MRVWAARAVYGLALGGAVLFYCFYFGQLAWYVLMLAVCLPLFSLVVSLPAMLTAGIVLHAPAAVEREKTCVLQVYMLGWMPAARMEVRISVEDRTHPGQDCARWLHLRGEAPAEWELDTAHCAALRCSVRRAWVYDYLGLFRLPVRRPGAVIVTVRPRPVALSPEPPLPEDIPPLPEAREETPDWKPPRLPLWRKALAAVSGAGAMAIFLYAANVTDLSAVVDKGGLTALGQKQLALYLVFCGLLLILALAIGRRSRPPAQVQLPVEKRRLSRRTTAAAASILLLIPVTLFVGVYYLNNQRYGLVSVLVLLECMAPFFLVFEGRRPQARELVVIAVLCAISVAGRAAFFMLPQFKPVMAMTIISGVALGGESGFLVGALSMLVSNMLFSQGVWTPWQMFCMGIIGFLAGVLFRKGLLRRARGSLCTFGAFCAIVIYGGIMNPASVLMWAGAETLTWKTLLTYYVTGFPVDCVHAAATVFFLWIAAEPMLEKLDRIKEKYGLLT